MRWPIRNQILLPFVGIQILTLSVISVTFACMSVKEAERETLERLSRVLTTLDGASFPLTQSVLDQLHLLSGAHFVVVDNLGESMASTLQAANRIWDTIPPVSSAPSAHGFIDGYSLVRLADESYFTGQVKTIHRSNTEAVVVLYPERRWRLARWNAIYPPLVIGCVALCFTVFLSIMIARRMGHRIRNVQDGVARIARGEFQPVAIEKVDDELSDLVSDINRMCVALETATRQMRETERANLITQVVGGLSHQLRNSLTGARMALQLHGRHCTRRDDEALEVALKQLRLTEEQIKGLLRLTRGESRTCTPSNVDEILAETISLVHPICSHNRITFETSVESSDGMVHDSDAIRGAVLNLLMNAIDAAGPEGRIVIASHFDGSDVSVDVSDDGPGVPTEIAKQIFDPLFTTKPEGIGLGLALVQKTAADFGGKLSMSRVDEMTTFRLTLRAERNGLIPAVVRTADWEPMIMEIGEEVINE